MQRDARAYLNDILEAAAAIQEATANINVEVYNSIRLLRSAVERECNISGSHSDRTRQQDRARWVRLPEMQRRYVWRSIRVCDLLDFLYRGYPSGAILIWESDERVSKQVFAMGQQANPYAKPPSPYILELIAANGPQPVESQCIVTDPAMLTPDRYHDFLSERCRCNDSRLNTYLGSASSSA